MAKDLIDAMDEAGIDFSAYLPGGGNFTLPPSAVRRFLKSPERFWCSLLDLSVAELRAVRDRGEIALPQCLPVGEPRRTKQRKRPHVNRS